MTDIPHTCKAAVVAAYGEPIQIIDVDVPQDFEYGSLLVKTSVATVCGSDVHAWTGDHSRASGLPMPLGHEMTGRIVAFGDGPRTDSVGQELGLGDRIIWTHGFCGRCPDCVVRGQPTACRRMRTYMSSPATKYPYLTGAFAEYVYVFPTSGRLRVPNALPDELASVASCALRTVVHGFERLGSIDDRHRVVIQGAGSLGLLSLAKALTSNAAEVIVIGGPADRLDVAKRWGATRVLDIDVVTDPIERGGYIAEWTDGEGPEVVIDVSGALDAFAEGIEMIGRGGRYLVLGQVHDKPALIKPSEIMLKQLSILGCISGSVEHYYESMNFMCRNRDRFAWNDLISERLALADVGAALRGVQSGAMIKPAILMGA